MTLTSRSRFGAALATGLLGLALVAGCGSSGDTSEAESAASDGGKSAATESLDLFLASPLGLIWTPVVIAEEQGFFADQGLKVNIKETNGSSYVTQQLIAGQAKYGFVSSGASIVASVKAPTMRTIGCLAQKNIFSMNVMPDSPIKSVAELSGKRIGVGDAASGEAQLVAAVIASNNLKDVEVVPLGQTSPAAAVRALKTGRVDVLAGGFSPVIADQVAAKVTFRDLTPPQYAPTPSDCVTVPEDVLTDETERAKAVKLIRALSQAVTFILANPDAAAKIACEGMPASCPTGSPEGGVFDAKYMTILAEKLKPNGSDKPFAINKAGWDVAADILLKSKVIESSPDMTDLVDSPEARAIQDEAQNYDEQAVIAKAQAAG